jgi:hypothetical protein
MLALLDLLGLLLGAFAAMPRHTRRHDQIPSMLYTFYIMLVYC